MCSAARSFSCEILPGLGWERLSVSGGPSDDATPCPDAPLISATQSILAPWTSMVSTLLLGSPAEDRTWSGRVHACTDPRHRRQPFAASRLPRYTRPRHARESASLLLLLLMPLPLPLPLPLRVLLLLLAVTGWLEGPFILFEGGGRISPRSSGGSRTPLLTLFCVCIRRLCSAMLLPVVDARR